MSMADAFLAEFEQELATTRRFLERLPEDRLDWRPHEKSMTAGELALHIAQTPKGVLTMAQQNEAPVPNFAGGRPRPKDKAEVLQALEESAEFVRRELPRIDDARMQATWRAMSDRQVVLTMPRAAFVRSIMLNHWIQHRGQFGVYLRLLGAKVPSSYGPSGDEPPAFLKKNA